MAAITALNLTSTATQTAAPFAFAQAFVRGEVPAGQYAHIDTPNFAVAPLCYWNDGSLKHALLMGRVDVVANTAKQVNVVLRTSAPAAGTLLTAASITAAAPTATAALTGYGTVSLASLLSAPVRTHISTKEMVECHYKAQVGSDSQLYAWFHVRLYVGGKMEVRVALGNGQLGAGYDLRSYPVTITIGGTVVFSAGTYYHAGFARYDVKAWIGGDPAITPQHDTGYLVRTGLVPNYWKYAAPTSGQLSYLNSINTYVPGANLGFSDIMGATGYQDDIGILPRWEAMYVATKGCKAAYDAVIAGARAINSFAIALSDATSLAPIKITDYPTWSVYGAGQGGSYGLGAVKQDGTSQLAWEKAHHPSAGYLAYLLTGEYYYFETCQHQARTVYLMDDINGGAGTSRVLRGQNRSRGWGYRSMAQAAAVIPTWLVSQYGDISTWMAGMAAANNIRYSGLTAFQRSLGLEDAYNNRGSPDANGQPCTGVGMFEHNFVAQSMGHALKLEPCGTSGMTSVAVFADHMLGAAVWPLGVSQSGSTDFPFPYASSYQHNIPSLGGALSSEITATTGDQIYNSTFSTGTAVHNPGGNTLVGSSGADPSIASGYWGNLLPAIAYAVDCGKAGASTAFARMTGASNWSSQVNAGYDDTPQFGIVPTGYAQQPVQITAVDSGSPSMPAIQGPTLMVTDGNRVSGCLVVSSTGGMGQLAQNIPAGGTDGDSPLRSWLQFPGDTDFEVSWTIASDLTAAGDLQTFEDGSMAYAGGVNTFSAQAWRGGLKEGTPRLVTASADGTISIVTGVTVSPSSIAANTPLAATVDGTGSPSQAVTWTATGGASVSSSGVPTLPAQTSVLHSGTIVATSVQDASHSGFATWTVAAIGSTITGISISPTTATGAVTFTKTVTGNGAFSSAATFSIYSGLGSVHPTTGAFTQPAQTGVIQVIVVRVTSDQDSNYHADATITIAAVGPTVDTTGPVMVGPISATATQTRIDLTWPAATDLSGIGGYFVSIDGGTPESTGLTRAASFASLTAGTAHAFAVTADDMLGNPTGAPLTLNFSTLAAPIVAPPPPPPYDGTNVPPLPQPNFARRGMSFLDMVKRLHQESGSSGALPSSTVNQVGDVKKLVDWISTAWMDIQNDRQDWFFMREPISFYTTAAKRDYTVEEARIETFANYKLDSFRQYRLSVGFDSEMDLAFMPYDQFRNFYLRGANRSMTGQPVSFTVDPAKNFLIGPIPDDIYNVNGEGYAMPTEMLLDADRPTMPSQYHMAIVWKALQYYGTFEAAAESEARGRMAYDMLMGPLLIDQLPEIELGGPLL